MFTKHTINRTLALSMGSFVAAAVIAATPIAALGSTIDGTIIRSFASPLGISTYGIGMDNDGTHAWINMRHPSGASWFTQIDMQGNEVANTRRSTSSFAPLPQGFHMDSAGELWMVDRSSFEFAVRATTSGSETARFSISFLDNPNDITMRNGDLYVVAPNNAGMHRFSTVGTNLGFIAFGSGLDAGFNATDAITYDGTNFWVARGSSTASMVYEIAPDGSVLSSFFSANRLLGLGYDATNDHLLATSGTFSDTIYVIGSVPAPGSLVLIALGGLAAARRRRV